MTNVMENVRVGACVDFLAVLPAELRAQSVRSLSRSSVAQVNGQTSDNRVEVSLKRKTLHP